SPSRSRPALECFEQRAAGFCHGEVAERRTFFQAVIVAAHKENTKPVLAVVEVERCIGSVDRSAHLVVSDSLGSVQNGETRASRSIGILTVFPIGGEIAFGE